MKLKFKYLLLSVCCAAALVSAGCNGKTYSVYTNMPESGFNLIDKSYKTEEAIGGYSESVKDYEEIDAANYTYKHETCYAMSAYSEWIVYGDFTSDEAVQNYENFSKSVKAKLYEIEKALSTANPLSDIYSFNNAKAGERLEIRQITYEVLSEAKYVYSLTEGFYNPALYYNIQIYGFGGAPDYPKTKDELPKDETIAKYTDLASHFGEIQLSVEQAEDGDKYFVTKPEYTVEADGEVLSMKLDLGGIGKGFAVDCVDGLFDSYGFKFGYFNFGTSSMLVKSNVKTGYYDLGLSGPRSPSRKPYLTTTVRNEKLSSSGDNEQYYTIDGTRYCHIISPKTGKPVQTGIMSVTVIGGSAAQADALTTAIMAMEKYEAISFIEQNLNDKRVVFTFE